MSAPHLRTVTRTQGNNRDLKDGTVVPEGFALDFVEVPVLV
jgi:4,5-dihydroxyphthalate decarboxylase